MTPMRILGSARRALKKPPSVVARRLWRELRAESEGLLRPGLSRTLDRRAWLLRETESPSLDSLWRRLGEAPYPAAERVEREDCDRFCTGGRPRILEAAARAARHEVELLGSRFNLGDTIDWHRDYKSGLSWPRKFYRRIDYHDFDRPSDVKFPWELSRFQWLLPLAQGYRLVADESYAAAARRDIDDWIMENPYGIGVNWACAMDVALRLVAWTWLFRAFHPSRAWSDDAFRFRFLRSLFLQARFVERNLEESDLNSNHYLADAVGLVFAGLFFGLGKAPRRWAARGWTILGLEGQRQVLTDGVDYEGSIAYHRLVMETLLYPALYRKAHGLEVPREYVERLARMAKFVVAYSKPDGTSPLIGDADDGRVLPLGGQPLLDHRYLVGLVAAAWPDTALSQDFGGPTDEIYWTLGASLCSTLAEQPGPTERGSAGFEDAGFFVMRSKGNHVFIDCGPVGLAGRGGHGHNDCLSFEAVLDGVPLITDSGTFTYTASYSARNRFRATSAHNTPWVDHREINRFTDPRMLWSLHDDAKPELIHWEMTPDQDRLRAMHRGYERLDQPVLVTRTLILDHHSCALAVEDEFTGNGAHHIEIPLHCHPDVHVENVSDGHVALECRGKLFGVAWQSSQLWTLTSAPVSISPSYGVSASARALRWSANPMLPVTFRFCISSRSSDAASSDLWKEWLARARTPAAP